MKGVTLGVSGSGYAEIIVDDERIYVHRLAAVAEHGSDALVGMDVHHKNDDDFDGGSCAWVNNPDRLEPQEPKYHRRQTLCQYASD